METMLFMDSMDLSEKNGSMTFFTFSNKRMTFVYKLIFGETLPRLTEEMKIYMQHSSDPVGDWFLYEDYTVLRVYGFKEETYKFPTFLSKRIFVLEFLRQRLYVESELFLKHKKSSNIKFKYTIEPFVVDSTSSLPIIQDLLRSMKFDQDRKVNYDPKHIISKRKVSFRLGTFEHEEDQELSVMANA